MLSTSRRAPRLEANAITGASGDYDGLLELIRLVEPARPAHGRHPRAAWRPPCPARNPAENRRLGAQLPYRRRAHDRDEPPRRTERRSAHPRTSARGCLPGRFPPRLERAIGVIYRPETERQSHYFRAELSGQFDAVIHIDETRAVEPLERTPGWELGEPPETYPTAL